MNPLETLIALKLAEKDLKTSLPLAQQSAIDYCTENNLTGKIPVLDAFIVLKKVKQKPKPTDEILALRTQASEIESALAVVNADSIKRLQVEIDLLSQSICDLKTNNQILDLRDKAQEMENALESVESITQITVTLPK